MVVLDVNRIINIQDSDASRLIEKGLAQKIDCLIIDNNSSVIDINDSQNKMINILYKKRGRPRKEG